jgi:HEAT repeat protein
MRTFLLSALVVALLLAGAGTGAAQPKGTDKDKDKKPAYPTEIGGKSLKEWIDAIAQPDRQKSLTAIQNVMLFDPKDAYDAVPVILKELKKHNPKGGTTVDASFRANAPAALALFMNAQASIVGALEKPDDKRTQELEKRTQDVVEALRPMLKDNQIVIKYRALLALTKFGSYIKDAVPDILPLVKDGSTWELRHAAVTALGGYPLDRSKKDKKEAVPVEIGKALLDVLRDPCAQVKLAALNAIYNLDMTEHEDSAKAVNARVREILYELPVAQREKDPSVRVLAILITYHLSTSKKLSRDNIAVHLDNRDPSVRVEVLHALGRLGTEARDQFYKVLGKVDAAKEKELGVRVTALQTLGMIGIDFKLKDARNRVDAVAWYAEPKNEKEVAVRGAAVMTLARLSKDQAPVVASYLGDKEIGVRIAALQALGGLGKDAKGQAGQIAGIVGNNKEDVAVRAEAIGVLAHIGPTPKQLGMLIDCLEEKDANIIGAAAVALGGMEPPPTQAVPVLAKVAVNADHPPGLRQTAEMAIRHINDNQKKKTDKKDKK